MIDWVKKAGKTKLQEKAQAIVDAVDEDLWENNPRFDSEYRAAVAALLEAINQTQNGQGMISAAELHLIAMEMKKLWLTFPPPRRQFSGRLTPSLIGLKMVFLGLSSTPLLLLFVLLRIKWYPVTL